MSTFTATAVCILVFALLFVYFHHSEPLTWTPSRGYLLTNKVTHARLFPVNHAFTYPTLSILISLYALENGELDLRVALPFSTKLNLFRFGSTWWTLLCLRGDSYLGPGCKEAERNPVSIRTRLDRALIERDVIREASEIRDAWMMTMPAMCGFEGINPLTVYFCYRPSGELSVIVLEVHNTFGEGHVYILQVGKNEDPSPPRGYHHQWTFPRRFFVSPFNDRSGFYTVAVKPPSHPPFNLPSTLDQLPKPSVRVHLHAPYSSYAGPILVPIDRSNVGPLKLVAHVTPKLSVPLTPYNLLTTLSRFPLTLFSTLPRILYHAWILHYLKRLPILGRPEPFIGHPRQDLPPNTEHQNHSRPSANDFTAQEQENEHPGGVISQHPSLLERYARHRMQDFLSSRCTDLSIGIALVPGDPSEDISWFGRAPGADFPDLILTINYASQRFFTLFLLAPSAELFLLAGCKTKTDGERPLFKVSDEVAFMRVFDFDPNREPELGDMDGGLAAGGVKAWIQCAMRRVRLVAIPKDVFSWEDVTKYEHPLARVRMGFWTQFCDLLAACTLVWMDWVQEWVFWLLRVRFVEGTEPWAREVWRRAGAGLQGTEHWE